MPHSVAKNTKPPPKKTPNPQMWLCPCYFHPSLSQEEHVDSQETAELQ